MKIITKNMDIFMKRRTLIASCLNSSFQYKRVPHGSPSTSIADIKRHGGKNKLYNIFISYKINIREKSSISTLLFFLFL
jgi:hypothetical protein